MSNDEAKEQLRQIGERLRALRGRLPAGSPLARSAFRLAATVGEMEAHLAAPDANQEKP